MKKGLIRKGLVFSIIILFIGVSVSSSIGKIERTTCQTTIFNGNLSGIVNNKSGYPIQGALVRVLFHNTYEEDYSNEEGYYHVYNISICKCLKIAICSKEDYKTKWKLIGISENTTYDFVLTCNEEILEYDVKSIDNNEIEPLDNDEDCLECQVSDRYSLFKVNLLFTRLKAIVNFISIISGENEESIPAFTLSGRPICDYLLYLFWNSVNKGMDYIVLSGIAFNDGNLILSVIYYNIAMGYVAVTAFAQNTYVILGCGPFPEI